MKKQGIFGSVFRPKALQPQTTETAPPKARPTSKQVPNPPAKAKTLSKSQPPSRPAPPPGLGYEVEEEVIEEKIAKLPPSIPKNTVQIPPKLKSRKRFATKPTTSEAQTFPFTDIRFRDTDVERINIRLEERNMQMYNPITAHAHNAMEWAKKQLLEDDVETGYEKGWRKDHRDGTIKDYVTYLTTMSEVATPGCSTIPDYQAGDTEEKMIGKSIKKNELGIRRQ